MFTSLDSARPKCYLNEDMFFKKNLFFTLSLIFALSLHACKKTAPQEESPVAAIPVSSLTKTSKTTTTNPSASATNPSTSDTQNSVYIETTRAIYSCGPDGGEKVVEVLDEQGRVISTKTYDLGSAQSYSTECRFDGEAPPSDDMPPSWTSTRRSTQQKSKNYALIDVKLTDIAGATYDELNYSLNKQGLARLNLNMKKLIFSASNNFSFPSVKANGHYNFENSTFVYSGWVEVRNKNIELNLFKKLDFDFSEKDCEEVTSKKLEEGILIQFNNCAPEAKTIETVTGQIFIHNDNILPGQIEDLNFTG